MMVLFKIENTKRSACAAFRALCELLRASSVPPHPGEDVSLRPKCHCRAEMRDAVRHSTARCALYGLATPSQEKTMLKRLFDPAAMYARRLETSLNEARMAAFEHENAAEHHAALARMYRQRIARLEAELAPATAGIPSRLILDPAGPIPRVTPLKKPREPHQRMPAYLPQGAGG